VRPYFAPLLWLIVGVVVLASHAYARSSRFRARVSTDRLAGVHTANNQRFVTIEALGVGLFCTYATVRNLIGGVETWWLWFLAAAAQFGVVALRRAAGIKPVTGEVRPQAKMKRNHRRALFFAVPAVVCLYAAQPVAGAAARLENGFIGAASIVLMVAALGGFVAAGWAVVWVPRERKPGKDPVAPQRQAEAPHNLADV
jgi:hypothetical protein